MPAETSTDTVPTFSIRKLYPQHQRVSFCCDAYNLAEFPLNEKLPLRINDKRALDKSNYLRRTDRDRATSDAFS